MEFLKLSIAISSLIGVVLKSNNGISLVENQNKYFQNIPVPLDSVVRFKVCHNPPLRYSAKWLHSRSSLFTTPPVCVQTELTLAGINKQCVLPTEKKRNNKRGKRSGRRKQRQIEVRACSYNAQPYISQHNVNKNNLILIDTRNVCFEPNMSFLIGHQNCRSCTKKVSEIKDLTFEENIDIMFLTETWLHKGDEKLVEPIKPPGYYFRSFPRIGRRGGGIAFLMKTPYLPLIESIKELAYDSF